MHGDDGNDTVVRVDGEQTIRTISVIHQTLCRALQQDGAVTIDARGVGDVDLTLVQLILAAKRSADLRSKAFRLAAPVEGALREIVERGGFLCSDTAGFWTCKPEAR